MTISWLTSKNRWPDFLIIGAQKSGTSSLHSYLADHPHIFMSPKKELHFFDLNYSKGPRWYTQYFREAKKNQLTAESTPYYLFHPGVPALIKKHMPNGNFIVLLRNPVERAYSHYQMTRKLGVETAATFEEALALEPGRLLGEEAKLLADSSHKSYNHQYFSYASRGMYAQQLERWFEFFAREKFLILRSEELFATPQTALAKVFDFLGMDAIFPQKYPNINAGNYENMPEEFNSRYQHLFEEDQKKLENLLG